jgi:hypothetical protein
MITIFLAASVLLPTQDAAPPASPPPVSTESAQPEKSVNPEALRERIREMRMNLLLGGERVRAAETEAVDFYQGKIASIEEHVDTIHADLAEKRASYDLALDRTLGGKDAGARGSSMAEAAGLRSEIASLEGESAQLEARRSHLYDLIAAVEKRDDERDRLVARLDAGPGLIGGFELAVGSVGLAPAVQVAEAGSPLEDDALVRDLLQRDPVGARRILFEADPQGYWERFPLRPPAAELRRALDFPPPDLPGLR